MSAKQDPILVQENACLYAKRRRDGAINVFRLLVRNNERQSEAMQTTEHSLPVDLFHVCLSLCS